MCFGRIRSTIFPINPPISLFSGAIQDCQSDLEKALNFQARLQGSKIQKNCSQGLRQTLKFDPRNIEELVRKNGCRNTFGTENLF